MGTNFDALQFANCSIEERQAIYNLASRFALAEIEAMQGQHFTYPNMIKKHLRLAYMNFEHEIFGVMLLNNQHQLITSIELFRGTVDGASVYPREVVKLALQHNASACIFFHNHPSGTLEPSSADKAVTEKLKSALGILDIRVLDHFIVTKGGEFSFAEYGML